MGKFASFKGYHNGGGRDDDEDGEVVVVFVMGRRNTTITNLVSVWLAVSITLLGFTRDNVVGVALAAENNLQYKEYWYKTEQLCPDLQESVAGKDIDTANLPYKSVFHFQSVSESCADLPCILETNGPQRLVSTALIEAIHVDNRPWNYSGSQSCEEHIKLRLPEPTFLKISNVPKIICRIPKSRGGSNKETTGSLFHPYVWQFQKGKLGLSFSSFNLSHMAHSPNASQQQQQSAHGKSYWQEPDPNGHQFVQIVFTTRFGGMCTLRVQQYLLDAHKTLCEGVQQRSPFGLCGLYDCSEKESILRTLGFWTHRKQNEMQRWCREDPTYLEILVSTLRALMMPLLFISVFYVTRRLRLKLATRQNGASRAGIVDRHRGVLRQRQCYLRSLMRDGGTNNSPSESSEQMLRPSLILNHVVYDIPVNGEYAGYEDLPPPYESIVQPPSYLEATNTVKSSSSPVATTSPTTTSTLPNESISSTDTNPSTVGDSQVEANSASCDASNIVPESESQSNDDEETVQLLSPHQQSPSPHRQHSSTSASTSHLPV